MKEFEFRVTQPLVGFYEGYITIEAESEEQALKIARNLSQEELESIVERWIQNVDEAYSDGKIEIHED